MSWTEIYTAYRQTKDAANTASGLIKFLEARYANPVEKNSTRIFAMGKTYDFKDDIKGYRGGGLFRWEPDLKQWYADVRDDQVDEIAEALAETSGGAVWIETDTGTFGKRKESSEPANTPQGQRDDGWPIPEEDIPF